VSKAAAIDCGEHLGLAQTVAGRIFARWSETGVDRDDLFQVVYLFMARCARRYDPGKINPQSGKPYAWSTYFVAAAMRSQSGIVAEAMGVKRSRGQRNLRSEIRGLSIDREIPGTDGVRRAVVIEDRRDGGGEPADALWRAALIREVEEIVEGMGPLWRDIYHARFVKGETLKEVVAWSGLSRGRVQQVHYLILDEIRRVAMSGEYPRLRDWVEEMGMRN
jgi:RNA polymerase sigma factor (sigma-70 family)